MVLMMAGLAMSALGAGAGMVGARKTKKAQERVMGQIRAENTRFDAERTAAGRGMADQLFGLGTKDQLNQQQYLERMAGQERTEAGQQGSQDTQQAGLSAVGDIMAGIPGMQGMNAADPDMQRILAGQAAEQGRQDQLNLGLLAAQGQNQGYQGFDINSAGQFDVAHQGLARQGTIAGQDYQTTQNLANRDHGGTLGNLEMAMGEAGKAGDKWKTIGALSQLAGQGMTSAAAYQDPAAGAAATAADMSAGPQPRQPAFTGWGIGAPNQY